MLPRGRCGAAYSAGMVLLEQALHGALSSPPRPRARAEALLVVGGGGTLGSAVLARALACGRFSRVQALVVKELASALRGFEPLPEAALQQPLVADTALLIFERMRRNNGRDEAFLQPQPEQLAALGGALHRGGVRRLLVVVPHAPALLPQALKAGLATLDEGELAALGFEQLLFMRSAQAGGGPAGGSWMQRLAHGWLAQMAWMVPQREQPVRAERLAELVVELAWRVAEAPPATRVLPPEVLWQAAQGEEAGESLGAWLHGRPLPASGPLPAQRW